LLCHFVASDAGLYKRENLDTELVDITFMSDAELPTGKFQVSCGSALSSALKGIPQRVVFVATDKPMFWIYSKKEIHNIKALKNKKLATFPAIAPPHHLANIVLMKSGLNVDQDISLLPARDDTARFGLLKSGDVDAAMISSAIAPAKLEKCDFKRLCCLGDELRVPTTGLAIDQTYLDKETRLIQTLVNILKQSLAIIHEDPDTVASVLHKYFDVDDDIKKETAKLLGQYYTKDGRTTDEIAQNAIGALSKSLSIDTVPEWQQIYKFTD